MSDKLTEYGVMGGACGLIISIFIPAFYQGATEVGLTPWNQMMILGFTAGIMFSVFAVSVLRKPLSVKNEKNGESQDV